MPSRVGLSKFGVARKEVQIQHKSSRRHTKKRSPFKGETRSVAKSHLCNRCPLAFTRPEHLKRHVKSHEDGINLPCPYAPHCEKRIKDREDNLNAHLLTTHYKYGKTERGGKNVRYSLQSSMDLMAYVMGILISNPKVNYTNSTHS